MNGKIFIHFFDNAVQKPDRKWLFWLKQQVQKLGIETIESMERLVDKQDIVKLQKEFEISAQQTFIAHHNPGTLSIIRFVEKVLEHKLEKALLVAGKQQSVFTILNQKELASGKQRKGDLEEINFSLEKNIKNISPALVIVWISNMTLLDQSKQRPLLSKK